MPKSRAEQERLKINAQAQQVLMRRATPQNELSKGINHTEIQQPDKPDIYQPEGEIDYYALYNKSNKTTEK